MSRLRNNLIFLEETEEKSGKEKETEKSNPISSSPEIIERFNGVASKDIKESEEKNKKSPDSKQ